MNTQKKRELSTDLIESLISLSVDGLDDFYIPDKLEFAAKSTINGIYVMLFTGTSRAVFGKHVPAREGPFVFTIPLSELKKVGPDYTLTDIDQIRFQFDSRSKTGCSMAIDKIWFE